MVTGHDTFLKEGACAIGPLRKMPGKTNKKRKTASGKYVTKKTPPKTLRATILYTPLVCPNVMRVKLPYTDLFEFNGGGIFTIVSNVFRGNSIFDPDLTGTGTQPLGRDQWHNFYNRYRVISSTIEVSASNASGISCTIYTFPNNNQDQVTVRRQVMEQQYVKQAMFGHNTGNSTATIKNTMSPAKIRGAPSDIVQYEDSYSAQAGFNPPTPFFWHVGVFGQGLGVSNFRVDATITITYDVEFYDRLTLSRS